MEKVLNGEKSSISWPRIFTAAEADVFDDAYHERQACSSIRAFWYVSLLLTTRMTIKLKRMSSQKELMVSTSRTSPWIPSVSTCRKTRRKCCLLCEGVVWDGMYRHHHPCTWWLLYIRWRMVLFYILQRKRLFQMTFTDFLVASDDDEVGENEPCSQSRCLYMRLFPVSCHYKIIAVKDIL